MTPETLGQCRTMREVSTTVQQCVATLPLGSTAEEPSFKQLILARHWVQSFIGDGVHDSGPTTGQSRSLATFLCPQGQCLHLFLYRGRLDATERRGLSGDCLPGQLLAVLQHCNGNRPSCSCAKRAERDSQRCTCTSGDLLLHWPNEAGPCQGP